MKEPKYKNEAVLIHCMKRDPHTLLFDAEFIKYDENTVLNLCEDLETNYEYLSSLSKNNNEYQTIITIANGLVWAGLFHHHNDIIPEKYKIID